MGLNMETNNEIKDFNIAEALKYAPKGLKLYTPLFGEVEFDGIEDGMIKITGKNASECFYEDGRYYDNYPNSECLLFPSINHRCWNNWQNTLFPESIGFVCVDTITGNKFILDHNGTCFSDYTGSDFIDIIENDSSNYLLNSRYATPEEAKEFFEELNKNGYKWDGETVVKIMGKVKPKFKVGDVIRHKDTGIFFAIAEVKDDCYYSKGKTCLLFKYQDNWKLAALKTDLSLEVKVSMMADEILALKQRVKALEIQVIKDMSTPPLTKDPYFKSNKITCDDAQCYKGKSASDVFKTPDKAGDNVTLEDMKG
jgi:hypothetical protein